MKKNYSMDMVNGAIFSKILRYSIPLMLAGFLQLLFNAADMIVVGKYSGPTALAAVGSTSALINLLINSFMGLSIGTNVLVARYMGANKHQDIEETVHTSIKLALCGGLFMIFVGLLFSKPLLVWMGTPFDVIDQSVLYMRIYFLCMPAFMIYNFGAAILRAVGDTKRPLYYLMLAGITNVCLNLVFVIQFNMGVAGVALATSLSQVLSAILVINTLVRSDGSLRLTRKHFKINKQKCIEMMKIGIPAGLQGVVFSLSNVLIQSSINSFGSQVMAGNTAANNIEGFVYILMNAIYQTALSFTSQNLGAKKLDRVKKVAFYCLSLVCVLGTAAGVGFYSLGRFLLSFYTTDPGVVEFGLIRMSIIFIPYALCGLMDVICGIIRGLGNSIGPMIISIIGVCGIRVLWIFTVFKAYPSLDVLYYSYPITWTISACAQLILLSFVYKKIKKQFIEEN